MASPIFTLQEQFVAALKADTALAALLDGGPICDAPTRGQMPPYIVIRRHDARPLDGDLTPGHDHRLLIHCRHKYPSRKAVLGLETRVIAVALSADLSGGGLTVTHVQHDRTDTEIDLKTGQARAVISLRILTEPSA